MNKTLLTILTLILTVTLGAQITRAIGSLTPSGIAGDDTHYSLNDVYDKLTNFAGTPTATSSPFTTPGSVSATFYTLTEIYNLLTAENANLVAGKIATGTTIFGVTGTLATSTPELEWSTNQGYLTWNDAVAACAGTVDGSTGWRLPTISELLVAISDDWIINNSGSRFADGTDYWSATEYDGSNAWNAYWYGYVNGNYDGKTSQYSVLCVR
jgi:Protein of unknown function (DUF1566)